MADEIFNAETCDQRGGNMVRIDVLGYCLDVSQLPGARVSDMTLLATGVPI